MAKTKHTNAIPGALAVGAGAVAGAAVGAAAVAMSNKKNRVKAVKTVKKIGLKAADTVSSMAKDTEHLAKRAEAPVHGMMVKGGIAKRSTTSGKKKSATKSKTKSKK